MSPEEPFGTLGDTANLALRCLHQHQLLTTSQLHAMVLPQATPRSAQRLTMTLQRRGLVASVSRRAGYQSRERVWYLTPTGTDVVQAVPGVTSTRHRPLTRQLAEGQVQQHTLDVNHVGLAFMNAARALGDECGPLAWEHEVVHRTGTRRTDVVISDAVLRYQPDPDHRFSVIYRFIELDRATMPVERLHTKLLSYARVAGYTQPGARREAWRERYLVLPAVLLVLTGAPPERLRRREQHLISLCRRTPTLGGNADLQVWICQLTDLTDRGPHSSVFTQLGYEDPCDWLGNTEGGRP